MELIFSIPEAFTGHPVGSIRVGPDLERPGSFFPLVSSGGAWIFRLGKRASEVIL